MITVLHGDDDVRIHTQLRSLLTAAMAKGIQALRLDAKGLTFATLENAIGTQELFASEKLVIVEGLHSLPKSRLKDQLISWIAGQSENVVHIVLVEKKTLTPTQLKVFAQANVHSYKLPAVIFEWLEKIGTIPNSSSVQMFHEVLKTQDAEFCFVMLCRQIRQLIKMASDGVYSGAPFMRTKVQLQARAFGLEKLLELHTRLLKIDIGQKTSRSALDLTQEIDVFLLEL